MEKKKPEKKQVEKIKEKRISATFFLKEKNKIPFIKIANENFMDFSKRLNFLIEQDIINNTKK